MIDRINNRSDVPAPTVQSSHPGRNDGRAEKFSSTLAAWMSRASAIKPNYAAAEEGEDHEPEPIKASAPIVVVDASKA